MDHSAVILWWIIVNTTPTHVLTAFTSTHNVKQVWAHITAKAEN